MPLQGEDFLKSKALILCLFALVLPLSLVCAQSSAAVGGTGNATAGAAVFGQQEEKTILLDGAGAGNPAKQGSAPGSSSLLRIVIVLFFLAGGVYLAIVLVRKSSPRADEGDSPIKVAASAALGPGKAVYAVCLGSKAWLVATSESSVSLIDTLDDPELVQDLLRRAKSAPPIRGRASSGSFSHSLGLSLRRLLSASGPGRKGAGAVAGKPRDAGRGVGSGSSGAGDAARGILFAQRGRLDKYRKGGDR